MTGTDVWVPIAAFLAGVAAAALAFWLWSRFSAPEPEPLGLVAPPPDPPARTPGPERATSSAPPRRLPRAPSDGYLLTSQRVILHLSRQPHLAFGDIAPATLTQAGMTRALSVAQPALARVLARLVDGEAVMTLRTHVVGEPRRLKVYQLTAHGEAIARDLRRQQAARAGAPAGTEAGGATRSWIRETSGSDGSMPEASS